MFGVNGKDYKFIKLSCAYLNYFLKVGKTGKAIGIEHIPELVNKSLVNIKKNHADLLDSGRIVISVGDGRLGYPEYAPFNAIHVGASAPTLPQAVCLNIKNNITNIVLKLFLVSRSTETRW